MKTCVIIPTFNESRHIATLVEKLKQFDLDVLVVDDGSFDDTASIARTQGAKVISNQRNMGKGESLKKGFSYCLQHEYDAVITMDGDGQHDPADVPCFLKSAQRSQSGMFIGNRMHSTKRMPWVRILTNRNMSLLISLLARQKVPDSQCGFRLIRKEVLKELDLRARNFEIETELILFSSRAGFRIESVPISTVYDNHTSRIRPWVDTMRFMRFLVEYGLRKGKKNYGGKSASGA